MIIDEEYIEEVLYRKDNIEKDSFSPLYEEEEELSLRDMMRQERLLNEINKPSLIDQRKNSAQIIREEPFLQQENIEPSSFSEEDLAGEVPNKDESLDGGENLKKEESSESFFLNRKTIRKIQIFVQMWIGGDILRAPWLLKYWPVLATIVAMFVLNVFNQYKLIEEVKKIDSYEEKIRDIGFMQLYLTKELTERSRQLDVEQRIQNAGLRLELSPVAPIIIYKSQEERVGK